jgi:hypothetical protein
MCILTLHGPVKLVLPSQSIFAGMPYLSEKAGAAFSRIWIAAKNTS